MKDPNATICIRDKHFDNLYNVKSDSCGHYSLTIPKGTYPYMSCIRMENYPNFETFNGNKHEDKLKVSVSVDGEEVSESSVFFTHG